MRLRSLGTQTELGMAQLDAAGSDSFYQDPSDFDEEGQIQKPIALSLSRLVPVSDGARRNAGLIDRSRDSGTKKKGPVADCFKPDTVKVHQNKGGDGFEAWKGNRRVIKKLQLGIRKKEQRIVPRTGQYAQPYNLSSNVASRRLIN